MPCRGAVRVMRAMGASIVRRELELIDDNRGNRQRLDQPLALLDEEARDIFPRGCPTVVESPGPNNWCEVFCDKKPRH
jgi:hypothetical protein